MLAFFSFSLENDFKIFGPIKIPSEFDLANKAADYEHKETV